MSKKAHRTSRKRVEAILREEGRKIASLAFSRGRESTIPRIRCDGAVWIGEEPTRNTIDVVFDEPMRPRDYNSPFPPVAPVNRIRFVLVPMAIDLPSGQRVYFASWKVSDVEREGWR